MSAHAPAAGHGTETAHDTHHAAEKGHAATDVHHAPVARNINDLQFGTTNRLRGVLNRSSARASARAWWELPGAPSLKNIGRAAAVTGAIAMPHVALAAYLGKKTYDFGVKHTPLAHVDYAIKSGANMVYEEAKNIASIPAYPVKLAGAVAMNTLIATEKVATNVALVGMDAVTDVEHAINNQYNLPEGTNLLAQLVLAGKNAVKGVFWDLPKGILQTIAKNPKTALGVGIGGTLVLANAGWDPILAASNVGRAFGDFFQWAASRFAP